MTHSFPTRRSSDLWAVYDCNWKTAIEAFLEPYHVAGTHTQLLAYGDYYALSKQYGLHSVSSYDTREEKFQMSERAGTTRAGKGDDPRVLTYDLIREKYRTVNYSDRRNDGMGKRGS